MRTTLFAFTLLLGGLLGMISCTPENDEEPNMSSGDNECGAFQVSKKTFEESRPDAYELDRAFIENGCLHIRVRHSGGCGTNIFSLIAPEISGQEETQDLLLHFESDDPCEAYPEKELSFSLENVESRKIRILPDGLVLNMP